MTMTEVWWTISPMNKGWSRSVPNLSGQLKRGSLQYGEALELRRAGVRDIVWQKAEGCEVISNLRLMVYIRVSTKEQNENRQVIALREVGVAEKNIYMDSSPARISTVRNIRKLLRR